MRMDRTHGHCVLDGDQRAVETASLGGLEPCHACRVVRVVDGWKRILLVHRVVDIRYDSERKRKQVEIVPLRPWPFRIIPTGMLLL